MAKSKNHTTHNQCKRGRGGEGRGLARGAGAAPAERLSPAVRSCSLWQLRLRYFIFRSEIRCGGKGVVVCGVGRCAPEKEGSARVGV